MAKRTAETVVLVIDEEGIDSLISELLKGTADNQAGFFCLFDPRVSKYINFRIQILIE